MMALPINLINLLIQELLSVGLIELAPRHWGEEANGATS
jgi:hypothetical protein